MSAEKEISVGTAASFPQEKLTLLYFRDPSLVCTGLTFRLW